MVTDFRSSNEDAFVSLIESGEMACAEDKAQFERNIALAKQYLSNVRDGAKEIKEFIQGTLKTDLKALKEEIKNK
jgi:hypothetical protein